jgi:YHS domain-containing protein
MKCNTMENIIVILFVLFAFKGFAQNQNIRISEFNLEKKVAIQGCDPVAYFKQRKAIKGNKELVASFEGVKYHFSSLGNKDTFLKKPSAYEPQYGGWCAYAMGDSDQKVEVNPETFKIIDGKLYLFYNAYFSNTLKSWNKNQSNLIEKADRDWKIIIQ